MTKNNILVVKIYLQLYTTVNKFNLIKQPAFNLID